MFERRLDPRTSKPFSLSNLLRTRAESERWRLAVVGDDTGFIMGSSRDVGDRQAARVAAHASTDLAQREQFVREARTQPGVKLVSVRIDVNARGITISVLVDPGSRSCDLAELAACVKRILLEPPRTSARTFEAAAA